MSSSDLKQEIERMKVKRRDANFFISLLFALISIAFLSGIAIGIMRAFQKSWQFGFAVTLVAAIGIVLQGLVFIPQNPPHLAIPTLFGRWLHKVRVPGWRFALFRPFFMGYTVIPSRSVNLDYPDQVVRTPGDNAPSKVPVSITYSPADGYVDELGNFVEVPELLHNYLSRGAKSGVETLEEVQREIKSGNRQDGVTEILEDIKREILRTWSRSPLEGPQNWEQLQTSGREASAILVKNLVSSAFPKIPSVIPSIILLKYLEWGGEESFTGKKEREEWQKRWKPIWEGYSTEEKEKIRKAVSDRRACIDAARVGTGNFVHPTLGIKIERLNVGDIDLTGKPQEAADRRVTEKLEAEAESIEAQNLIDNSKKISEELAIPTGAGLDAFQVERGKVTRTIDRREVAVDHETRGMITGVADPATQAIRAALAAIASKWFGASDPGGKS
jgi:regulator of protease activity HflC (stomatin/prohibitin superfamily)